MKGNVNCAGHLSVDGIGISYNGISGGGNSIALKWGTSLTARIDNNRDYPIASTTRVAEVEEAFDKKLAIKDKLIEKLSARLDKLEKRMK